jgi:UDP-glucose:(glucosyl)LPS alpha-1,2-glucosyltransferase
VKLNIEGDIDNKARPDMSVDAMGGTELMKYALRDKIDPELLNQFNIIPTRVLGSLPKDKKNILWIHDTAQDPEVAHLKDGGWKKFDKLVFVSHQQQQQFAAYLGVPYSAGVVLQNAIEPIEAHAKPDAKKCVNLIYHTTPHRGLELLIPVMQHIKEVLPHIEWHLDVYSSFGVYGPNWEQRNKPYEKLFKQIDEDPNMTYHGFVSNVKVKEALKKAHIYALPSIWPETSCISMIEAMSARCMVVHSSLAALPETAANWTLMYDFTEDHNDHARRHALTLMDAMQIASDENMQERLDMQKAYTDGFYSWNVRAQQWQILLQSLITK